MAAQHTPGPWMVNPANRLEVCPQLENGKIDPSLVTRVPSLTTHGEANARLIAAAPDLLKACADWLAYIDADGELGDGEHEERLFAQMRAAVASARGESA